MVNKDLVVNSTLRRYNPDIVPKEIDQTQIYHKQTCLCKYLLEEIVAETKISFQPRTVPNTFLTSDLLNDPAKTPLGRRQQLKDMVTMSDDDIKNMTPAQIRDILKNGADLDEKGNPKQKDGSLKIHIQLDLEVEVHLTARVQGDVTIGLL